MSPALLLAQAKALSLFRAKKIADVEAIETELTGTHVSARDEETQPKRLEPKGTGHSESAGNVETELKDTAGSSGENTVELDTEVASVVMLLDDALMLGAVVPLVLPLVLLASASHLAVFNLLATQFYLKPRNDTMPGCAYLYTSLGMGAALSIWFYVDNPQLHGANLVYWGMPLGIIFGLCCSMAWEKWSKSGPGLGPISPPISQLPIKPAHPRVMGFIRDSLASSSTICMDLEPTIQVTMNPATTDKDGQKGRMWVPDQHHRPHGHGDGSRMESQQSQPAVVIEL